MNLLAVRKIEATRPKDKPYFMKDGGSLFVRVQTNGSKLWRYRYRLGGAAHNDSIGVFPTVTLEAARKERDWAHILIRQGRDPMLEKRLKVVNQFEAVVYDWMKSNGHWSDSYVHQVKTHFEKDVLPKIGKLLFVFIKASHLRLIIQSVVERDAATVAILIRQWCGQLFV